MKMIDIWEEVLRERGIPRAMLECVRPKTEAAQPTAAELMRREVPPEHVKATREMFEEIADHLFHKLGKGFN